jgi:spore germination protein YaaH
MPKGQMAALLADPAKRTAHVAAVVKVVDDGGYDGIDLDYEQFAFADDKSTWATVRPNWVAFVTELAAALHAKGKLLSVSLPPIYDAGRTADSGYWVYDYAAMGAVVDRIRIMGYDYSVSSPGPIAPYDWVRSAVRAAKAAVRDHTKLVLGVGLYGRNWVISTSGTCPATAEGTTAVTQQSISALIAKRQAVPLHDAANAESSFVYQLLVTDAGVKCTQTREVHYIDVAGAKARIDLARAERIGGVSLWALGFDTEALWTAIKPVARAQE